MANDENKIPYATAKRLPLYYRFLQSLSEAGKQRVSSSELSDGVKVDSATIRRDFSYFGALGKKGYGYNVNYLLSFFSQTLDQNDITKVMLVGVGNLGTALLNYNFIKNNNIRIAIAFDNDPKKVGTEIAGTPIHHLDELSNEEIGNANVAILTVPAQHAQTVAERLVDVGVKAILNFTPERLSLPEEVLVHHIDLSVELQSLLYFMKNYSSPNGGSKH